MEIDRTIAVKMSRVKVTTARQIKEILRQVPDDFMFNIADNYTFYLLPPYPDLTAEELLDAPRCNFRRPIIVDLDESSIV